ncbi:MAG: RluA family pseudouridine synthase [Candidatus Omnitrophota bacterium]
MTTSPILYEDSDLLIVEKPEGVLSHPNPGRASGRCAFEGKYDPARRVFESAGGPLWLIHRLDQDTSGVLLAAKTHRSAEVCREQFEKGEIRKIYRALALGRVHPREGAWRDHLIKKIGRSAVRSLILKGKAPNAVLTYRLEKYFQGMHLSLLEILLVTGKTHQIRIQAAFRGWPIVGDEIYGDFRMNKNLRGKIGAKRLMLHASSITFRHPETCQEMTVTAELPPAFEEILKNIG